ncbi:tRNA pseudouridine synthase Pus10 [uncultured archaeon]|nr:tRNA pseudouridine synthase Pus10 [uncultured archaeon]
MDMAYSLCSSCRVRHPRHPDVSPAPAPSACFICQGVLEQMPQLIEQALASASNKQWASFMVQTTFSRPLMAREEEIIDGEPLEGVTVIKNQANRLAGELFEKKTAKPYAPDGEIAFKLDFKNLKGSATAAPIFIFGHYIKKSRTWCQHDWACMACRGRGCPKCHYHKQEYPAIESALREIFVPAFGASDGYLHASGREDVDVMCLATGRPFVIELLQPQKREADLPALASALSAKFPLEVHDLKYVQPFWPGTICTSHFDKHYRAWVKADRELTGEDWKTIEAALPIRVKQQTPVRVLRRRADLVRPRHVYSISPVSLSPNEWVLDIFAEAGTYIKELIHGDGGRTQPSFTSLLKTPCKCAQLDVMGVEDAFVQTLNDGPKRFVE